MSLPRQHPALNEARLVFTLRRTKRLLVRLHATPALAEVEPTTRLGNWYANLPFPPAGQVMLFVNEQFLLPGARRGQPGQ